MSRRNRRVKTATIRPGRRTWLRLYRDGEPVAIGQISRDDGVTWAAVYNLPELFEVNEETGAVRSLGYA